MMTTKKRIQSRLLGPHTKAMNASEYELLSALLTHNKLVLPLFNTFAQGDVNTSLESLTLDNSAQVDSDFKDGYIIPFDLVNLHLPSKGYAALKHIARPDLFYVKDNVVVPIDIKNSVRSQDNLRQISSDTMTHIFEHNEYFGDALVNVIVDADSSLDELVFDDGFSLSMIADKKKDSLLTILENFDEYQDIDFSSCSSESANKLFDIFLDGEVVYTGKVSALEMQKCVGDVQTAIHHLGAAPYSLLVVDALDNHSNPAFRFSYLRNNDRPLCVFPTDIVLAEHVRDEYATTFYSNPREIDTNLEKLFLPARLQHKIDSLEDSIKRDKHRVTSINRMISLSSYQQEKTKAKQEYNAKPFAKIRKLKNDIEHKKEELSLLHTSYHEKKKVLDEQKDAYAKHSKLGWEKYFGPLFTESMDRFNDEIKSRKGKFLARERKIEQLNDKFLEYSKSKSFLIGRSQNLAKLYISVDNACTYHTFSLSEKRLLSNQTISK